MARTARSQITFADLEFQLQGITLDPMLQRISDFLGGQAELVERVRQDLARGLKNPATGRRGLSPSQVLRSLVMQRVKNWDYRELRDRIADGYTLRRFTHFFSEPVPGHDAFHRAFGRLTPGTLHAINDCVVQAAVALELEQGDKLRVDTTVVETDIHYPTDNTLLADTVRVVSRLAKRLVRHLPKGSVRFRNRTRSARRRSTEIERLTPRQRPEQQLPKYRELIGIAKAAVREAEQVLQVNEALPAPTGRRVRKIERLRGQLTHYCVLGKRVIDQAHRRVLLGEEVPNNEKIFSIFEDHTDLIKRGKPLKPVEFGHKVFLAESAHGLITQYRVLDGNPSDTDHVESSLEGHKATFTRAPHLYAADRGFYSAANLAVCHEAEVKVACIPQRGGKKTPEREEFEKSAAFKKGQRFRAGAEGRISVLFRGRGMKRCFAHGRDQFDLLVGAAVLANNLLVIAELLRKQELRRQARRRAA